MEITPKVPARLQDAYNSFYSSLQDDMQKDNAAVKDAAMDQDNPDSDSTQQTS